MSCGVSLPWKILLSIDSIIIRIWQGHINKVSSPLNGVLREKEDSSKHFACDNFNGVGFLDDNSVDTRER